MEVVYVVISKYKDDQQIVGVFRDKEFTINVVEGRLKEQPEFKCWYEETTIV